MEKSGPGLLFDGSFLLTDLLLLLSNWSIQMFLFFLIQLWKIMFLGTYFFLLHCPIIWYIIVHIILLEFLYFCGVVTSHL